MSTVHYGHRYVLLDPSCPAGDGGMRITIEFETDPENRYEQLDRYQKLDRSLAEARSMGADPAVQINGVSLGCFEIDEEHHTPPRGGA